MQQFLDQQYPTGTTRNPTMMHTLQRHRDVLYEYTKEWRKYRENRKQMLEQQELLNSVQQEIQLGVFESRLWFRFSFYAHFWKTVRLRMLLWHNKQLIRGQRNDGVLMGLNEWRTRWLSNDNLFQMYHIIHSCIVLLMRHILRWLINGKNWVALRGEWAD